MDMHTAADRRSLHRSALFLAFALGASLLAAPAFAAAPASTDAEVVSPIGDLAPGQFEWTPEASPTGPVTIVVSIPAQMVHVYRGDVRIGRSTVSSGRPGYDTPTGTFEILEKDRTHHSNKYDNAPMPFMQRLTWDGVALHAGHIPGYPASHGCVRLPMAFAEKLFEVTEKGGRVIVADETTASEAVLYPGDRVPVDPWTGREPGTVDTGVATATLTALPVDGAAAPALAGK